MKYIILILTGLLMMIIGLVIVEEAFPYNLLLAIPGSFLFGYFIIPAFKKIGK